MNKIDKELALKIIKLLSALEAAGLITPNRLPDYLYDDISAVIDTLSEEILK